MIDGVNRAFSIVVIGAALIMGLAGKIVSAADGRRVALVIGNGAYGNMPNLANPPRDAALIAAKLQSVGFEVDLAINDDQLSLERRVRAFGIRARGASAALFYYAGHGLQAEGNNYLLPVDARVHKVADLRYRSLPLSSVSEELDSAGAKINLIILDACRDNPLTRSLVVKNGTRSVNITRGLAPAQRASGTLIAYATAPGDVAYDGFGTQNSPFTQALADWIEEPGLEIAHMFRRVREQVIATTDGKQTPWIEEAILGDFYFQPPASLDVTPTVALSPPEPAAPVATPLPEIVRDQELMQPSSRPSTPQPNDPIEAAWSETTALGTRDAYIKFLGQYPNSIFAQKAVAMLLQFASTAAPAAPATSPVPAPSSKVAAEPEPPVQKQPPASSRTLEPPLKIIEGNSTIPNLY